MARIAGVDVPRNKRVVISLTYIYGIGKVTSEKVLNEAKISHDVRVKDLTEEELNKIRAIIDGKKDEGIKMLQAAEKMEIKDATEILNKIK